MFINRWNQKKHWIFRFGLAIIAGVMMLTGFHQGVGFMNTCRPAQLTLVLGGFLGKDVALERLTALDAATGADAKAFFCAAFGFHLWHNDSIYLMTPGGP